MNLPITFQGQLLESQYRETQRAGASCTFKLFRWLCLLLLLANLVPFAQNPKTYFAGVLVLLGMVVVV